MLGVIALEEGLLAVAPVHNELIPIEAKRAGRSLYRQIEVGRLKRETMLD